MTTSRSESLATGTASLAPSFVINLCSSTSPMALTHPSSPELKRYTFFVSRQREDGRERFRLHMGYFTTQEDAEQLLSAVRDVYPAAWAGPAPTQGVARRGRVAPMQVGAAAAPKAAEPAAAPAPPPAPAPVGQVPQLVADTGMVAAVPEAAPGVAAAPADGEAHTLEQTMSEMRSVLNLLGDDVPTAVAPTAPPARPEPPVVQPVQPVPTAEPPRLQPVTQPKLVASKPAAQRPELTPAQTLKVLEAPARTPASVDAAGSESKVQLLTPEDTQTLRDIRLDKANNAPPCFAVQLVWSVTPIDAAAMPHMAIFDAYTLYNVEGSRGGRKWYGLRLGFFTDPNSATQVANYVRGDYASVAVVPVAIKERDRATGGSTVSPADSAINPPLKASEQLVTNRETMAGFELVTDDRPAANKRDIEAPREAAAPTAARARIAKALNAAVAAKAAPPVGSAAPKINGKPTGKRVVVRKKPDFKLEGAPGAAAVLESTLDILGASTLTLDEGKGVAIERRAEARSANAKKPANSKFSKLLSRLSGG
jgi:hypothetical protein